MKIQRTKLDGVLVIEPVVRHDERGFFMESYSARTLAEHGIHDVFVQDNHSRSARNVVRGMHYKIGGGEAKLLRVTSGAIWDVAVDIRWGSPTWGQWVGVELTADNFRQFYVPVGFAHGFCVLSETADLLYKASSFYSPADERGLAWDDPTVAISWPTDEPILSPRDRQNPRLDQIEHDFVWEQPVGRLEGRRLKGWKVGKLRGLSLECKRVRRVAAKPSHLYTF